jgi:hypothetical protein
VQVVFDNLLIQDLANQIRHLIGYLFSKYFIVIHFAGPSSEGDEGSRSPSTGTADSSEDNEDSGDMVAPAPKTQIPIEQGPTEVQYEEMETWCTIHYYELNSKQGQPFEGKSFI